MKPKHQRLIFILVSVVFLCGAALLTMRAFRDNIVFFYSPTEMAAKPVNASQIVRIGGLVKTGSVRKNANGSVDFIVTDNKTELSVTYHGMLPGLFRDGQGVIVEGYAGDYVPVFNATRVLTKHDERYMPRDVVDALKKSGRWQENGSAKP